MEFVLSGTSGTCVKYSLARVKFSRTNAKSYHCCEIAIVTSQAGFFSQNNWTGFVFEKKFDNLFIIDFFAKNVAIYAFFRVKLKILGILHVFHFCVFPIVQRTPPEW